jgi:uncharacterized membrane protein
MEAIWVVLALVIVVAPITLSIMAITQVSQSLARLRDVEQKVAGLSSVIEALRYQIAKLTPPAAPPAAAEPPAPSPAPAPAPVPARPPVTHVYSSPTPDSPPPRPRPEPTPVSPPPVATVPHYEPAPPAESLEAQVGKRWTTWIGSAALFLAVAFFIKYAIDVGWIGPTARITFGILFGLAMLVTGDRLLRRGWRAIGEGLMGGGLAIVYLSLYAAYAAYHLFGAPAAFAAMVVLTGLGMTLAVVDNALALSVLAVLGGFITPVMISSGGNQRDVLMVYLLVLDLSVLGVAVFRRWRSLDLLAFAGSWLLFAAWFSAHYTAAQLLPTGVYLTIFYLLFLALPFVFHIRTGTPVTVERFALAILNALITFSFLYTMLHAHHRQALGFVALAMSATSLLMGSLTRTRVPTDARTLFGFITLAVAFLTMAVPLELPTYGIALSWAVEGPVLLYLGYRFRYFPVRAGAALILVLAACRLFAQHWPLHTGAYIPFLNSAFLSAASIPLCMGVYAYITSRWRREATDTDTTLMLASGIGGGLFGLLLVQVELGGWLTLSRQVAMAHYFTAALWAAGGLIYVLAGLQMRRLVVQAVGLLPLVIGVIAAISLYFDGVMAPIFINPRFGVSLFVVLCLFFTWHAIRRRGDNIDLQQGAFGLFEFVLFTLLSQEAYLNGPYGIHDAARAQWMAQMALTITWGVFAVALLTVGFIRLSRGLRITALVILGVTALKLLFVDLAQLEQIYRILSFFVVGLLMIGASYLYHRVEKRLAAEGDAAS